MLWQFIFEAAIIHSVSDKGQEVTKFIVVFDSGHSVVSSRVFDKEPRKNVNIVVKNVTCIIKTYIKIFTFSVIFPSCLHWIYATFNIHVALNDLFFTSS